MARRTGARSIPGRAGTPVTLGVGIALLAAVLWTARWAIVPSHVAGDTIWYARQTLELAGRSAADALRDAATFMVAQGRGSSAQGWIDVVGGVDPRYQAIFAARPLYPMAASLLAPALGPEALVAVVFLAAVALGLVLAAIAVRATGSSIAAVLVVGLAFLLPSGHWLVFVYADALMLAIWAAGLASLSMTFLDGRRRWIAAFAISFVLLTLAKPANAVVLGLAAIAAGLLGFVLQRQRATTFLSLAVVAAGLLAAQAVGSAILGLPSAEASVQDFLTHHFVEPIATDPWLRLARYVTGHATEMVTAAIPNPPSALVMLVGLAALARSRWTLPWLFGAVLTLGVIVLHPVVSEVPRLIAPIWVSVALGLGVGSLDVARRIQARIPLPGPAAEV